MKCVHQNDRIKKMSGLNLTKKKLLIRVDLNVPLSEGKISSDKRIRAILPTLKIGIENKCTIILISHMGRPKEGQFDKQYSLKPVAEYLSQLIQKEVRFISEWEDGFDLIESEIVLLENIRFSKGEKDNCDNLSKKLADLCDIFVMEAFGSAHRKHASTYGVIEFSETACAGPLMRKELDSISQIYIDSKRPITAIVGGSKISTKLEIIKSLSNFVDYLILGGGIANTNLKAQGKEIGKSLYEESMLSTAEKMIAANSQCQIMEISDVVVSKEISDHCKTEIKDINSVSSDDLILDIGPKTINLYGEIIKESSTLIWNGPVGVFEIDQFSSGTEGIAQAISQSDGYSIAGGGDTVSAIEKFGVTDGISYISTGGGAFLEFLCDKTLPSIEALKNHTKTREKGP